MELDTSQPLSASPADATEGLATSPLGATRGVTDLVGVWSVATRGTWYEAEFDQTRPDDRAWVYSDGGDFHDDQVPVSTSGLLTLDADGDGDLDIAHWPTGNHQSLYLNQGNGTLSAVDAGELDTPPAGSEVEALTALDANGDGMVDLVAALEDGGLLYLNTGNGVYQQAYGGDLEHWSSYPEALMSLDANGDGHADVAVTTSQRHLLFLNDGSGAFSQAEAGQFDDPGQPRSRAPAAFDADGDGDMDILVRNTLYRNDGSGAFTATTAFDLDLNPQTDFYDLVAFDADGDGDQDLAIAPGFTVPTRPNWLYLNNGDGTFVQVEAGAFDDAEHSTRALEATDVDLDGDLDLVGAVYRAPFRVYLNDGHASFAEAVGIPSSVTAADIAQRALVALDVNDDHYPDLAEGAYQGNSLYLNQMQAPTCVALAPAVYQQTTEFGDSQVTAENAVALDADADGDQDLVLGGSGAQPSVLLLNTGEGHFERAEAGDLDDSAYSAGPLLAFDANGDGDSDLVVASRNANVPNHLFINDGQGHFSLIDAGDLDDQDPRRPSYDLIAFDVDGDGDLDVADANDDSDHVKLFLNDGTGVFTRSPDVDSIGLDVLALAALDADGDGDLDLALGGEDGSGFLKNDGSGTLTQANAGQLGWSLYDVTDLAALDADGDGDVDLAAGRGSWGTGRHNSLLLNDGSSRFSFAGDSGFGQEADDTRSLVAFDVDGDGDSDLAVGNLGEDEYSVEANRLFINDGQGHFSQAATGDFATAKERTRQLVVLDADGDQHPDLVAANGQGPHTLYLNDGQGTLTRSDAGELDAAGLTNALVVFDANGDGDPDLAVANWGHNELYRQWNHSLVPADASAFGADFLRSEALAAFDADGDGDLDLATGNYEEPNALFLNDGQGHFARAEAGQFGQGSLRTLELAPLDADGDGDLDLAVGNHLQPNRVFLNDGHGSFTLVDAGEFDDNALATQALAAFDADGDGDLDLAVGVDTSDYDPQENALFLNDGHAWFTLADSGQFGQTGHDTRTLLPFDADGDGDLDLARAGWGEGGVYLNDGRGRFQEATGGDLPYRYGYNEGLLAHDADADGDLDLVLENRGLYVNHGGGIFTWVDGGQMGQVPTDVRALASLDLDDDGDLDVIEGNRGRDAVYSYEGLFDSGQVVTPPVEPGHYLGQTWDLQAWRGLHVREQVPAGSALTYDVLDPGTGQPITGFAGLRPVQGYIDLSSLDASQHPDIKVQANLMDLTPGPDFEDVSPAVCALVVDFSLSGGGHVIYLPAIAKP